MPEGQVLEFSGLTKRFGSIEAVSGFTARVEPGVVTGFLGPNGAGKTTTLRALLGLVRTDAGTATIGGRPYAGLANPLRTVGAVLEASSFHPGRSAANHLKIYAQAAGLPVSTVDTALGMVGLADVAGRKVGGYSLGMRQRLGLAYALLGDPGVLVLDEPSNGLDPEGIKWLRGLLRELAKQGRTVLVSSHLLAEVQQTVDALLIIARGRLVFQGDIENLVEPSEFATIVDSPDRAALTEALNAAGVPFDLLRSGFTIRGTDAVTVGAIAASAGVALSSLQRRGPALEEVFLDLVNGVRVHASATGAIPVDAAADLPAPAAVSEPEPPAESEPEAAAAAAAEPEAAPAPAGSEEISVSEDAGDRFSPQNANTPQNGQEHEPPAAEHAAFAVAATGVIDIIPSESESESEAEAASEPAPEPAPTPDADPDVEAIGGIDDELEWPPRTDDEPEHREHPGVEQHPEHPEHEQHPEGGEHR